MAADPLAMFGTGKATVVATSTWIFKVISTDNIPDTIMVVWIAFPNRAGIHTSFHALNF